jgi:hypothetical protein
MFMDLDRPSVWWFMDHSDHHVAQTEEEAALWWAKTRSWEYGTLRCTVRATLEVSGTYPREQNLWRGFFLTFISLCPLSSEGLCSLLLFGQSHTLTQGRVSEGQIRDATERGCAPGHMTSGFLPREKRRDMGCNPASSGLPKGVVD